MARALLGETMWALQDHDQARELFRNATLGLLGNGDTTALAEACAARARTIAEEEDPEAIFQPVTAMVESQRCALMRMEYLLARARWLRVTSDNVTAFRAFKEAAALLNQVAGTLNDTDRAALRVHPWSRIIRLGLRTG
jgi:hypothetical protein